MFDGPRRIDTSKLVRRPTPDAWRRQFKDKEVSVLSLVKDPSREYQSGWVSYRPMLVDSPEVEIISGGLSERSPDSAALWRQGNLFHFGFDLAPSEMNQTGQALLLNSIAYIARFTEDRPIARTPSPFREPSIVPKDKRWIEGLFSSTSRERDFDSYLTPQTKAEVRKMDQETYNRWYKANSLFITCDQEGKLLVDTNAKALAIVFDAPGFFTNASAKLADPATAPQARALLCRYAPEGPLDGSPEQWTQWWQTNRPYLFYSLYGGYRWYLDPLAQHRAIPSDKLRGAARATTN